MDARLLEPDVLYVFLPPEPQLRPELALLRDRVPLMGNRHLVLDLARVEIITSPSIGSLLLLQRQLGLRERRVVLCSARLTTKCIFRVAGLDTLLDFAEDRMEAMTIVRGPHESSVATRGMSR